MPGFCLHTSDLAQKPDIFRDICSKRDQCTNKASPVLQYTYSYVYKKNVNKGRGGSAAWGGLCLKFYPKCSKFGTIVHLGSKIWGKIK